MKKLLLVFGTLVLVPMFAFADASAVEKKDSPSEVLNKLLTATFKNFDYATAMALSHGWQKDFLRMQAKSMAWLKKSAAAGDAEAQAKLAKIKVKSAQFTWEIKDEKIDGDLAVVDKELQAKDGDFVIAFVDGEFTIKEFRKDPTGDFGWLVPWNSQYPKIRVDASNEFIIWGVVTYVIHGFLGARSKGQGARD